MNKKNDVFGIRNPFIGRSYRAQMILVEYKVEGDNYYFPITVGYNNKGDHNILIEKIISDVRKADANNISYKNISFENCELLRKTKKNIGVAIVRKIGKVFIDDKPAPTFDCFTDSEEGIQIAIEIFF